MHKKIKWNGNTLDATGKDSAVSVTFTDADNAVLGQYTFDNAIDFNGAYCSNAVLRGLIGDSSEQFHKFKSLTGLYKFNAAPDLHMNIMYLLDPKTKFNCGGNNIAKVSKILKLLHREGILGMAKFIMEEQLRMNKRDALNGFDNYYEFGLIQHVLEMCDYDESAAVEDIVSAILRKLRSGEVPGYNWQNYEMLAEAGLYDLIHFYDDKHMGVIRHIHSINGGKYRIVQTDKDGEKRYYPGQGDNYNFQFEDFETCLLHIMFPKFADSVVTLYYAEHNG